MAIRAKTAIEMSDLPFQAMLDFYSNPEDEDAAEAVQDISS